jgi:hypothetical protein
MERIYSAPWESIFLLAGFRCKLGLPGKSSRSTAAYKSLQTRRIARPQSVRPINCSLSPSLSTSILLGRSIHSDTHCCRGTNHVYPPRSYQEQERVCAAAVTCGIPDGHTEFLHFSPYPDYRVICSVLFLRLIALLMRKNRT